MPKAYIFLYCLKIMHLQKTNMLAFWSRASHFKHIRMPYLCIVGPEKCSDRGGTGEILFAWRNVRQSSIWKCAYGNNFDHLPHISRPVNSLSSLQATNFQEHSPVLLNQSALMVQSPPPAEKQKVGKCTAYRCFKVLYVQISAPVSVVIIQSKASPWGVRKY